MAAETGTSYDDTISLADWLKDSSLEAKSLWNRRAVVRLFEKTNRRKLSDILLDIKAGKTSPYATSKVFMDGIRKDYAPYTVYTYRSLLPGMFESILGESAFSKRKFDRLVPNGSCYISHVKQIPERPQVVEMLKLAPPLYRAVIGGLACGGFRIGEWLSRKMSDLEIREQGYARVTLQAKDTKAKYLRYSFLTREVVDWIRAYRKLYGFVDSEYVFPGDCAEHLSYNGARIMIKPLFRKVGLLDKPDKSEVYTIHSFRTFASDALRDCGLPEKYCYAIIGHKGKLGAEGSYIDYKRVESAWVEHCASKMQFLDNSAPLQSEVSELTRTNGKLEALLEKLLEKLA
ncbi:MAG TPA: site-specific integrase [Candidatus Angelobacter sp.]|nr:site-specific integrase [Candidatus Angelobacter sp.]